MTLQTQYAAQARLVLQESNIKDGAMEYSVYLAGRIANLTYDEAMASREAIIHKLTEAGIMCRTPLRGRQYKSGRITSETFTNGFTIQEIIGRDLNDIDRSDAVVILTGDDASWGTAGEFYYATWVVKKPTLVIAKNHVGGWVEHFATRIVPDIDSTIEVLLGWKHYWNGDGKYDTR